MRGAAAAPQPDLKLRQQVSRQACSRALVPTCLKSIASLKHSAFGRYPDHSCVSLRTLADPPPRHTASHCAVRYPLVLSLARSCCHLFRYAQRKEENPERVSFFASVASRRTAANKAFLSFVETRQPLISNQSGENSLFRLLSDTAGALQFHVLRCDPATRNSQRLGCGEPFGVASRHGASASDAAKA